MPHAHLKWKCLQEAADAAHFPNVITLGRYTCRQQQYHCCCCCCCCRAFSIWISLPASLPSPRAPSPSLDWQNNNNNWGQPASREHSSDLHARQNLYIFTDYIHTHTHLYRVYTFTISVYRVHLATALSEAACRFVSLFTSCEIALAATRLSANINIVLALAISLDLGHG